MTKIPLLVIVGPTAVGKTALSLKLAEELKGEIISADSMQIYQEWISVRPNQAMQNKQEYRTI